MSSQKLTSARSRKTPAERRTAIREAAKHVLLRQGYLPVPIEQMSQEAGISKALVYNYFPDPTDIYNELLLGAAQDLEAKLQPVRKADGDQDIRYAVASALAYFDHITHHANILQMLLVDPYLREKLDQQSVSLRNRWWRHYIRRLRQYTGLGAREAQAAFTILLAIPEELGRRALNRNMQTERARLLCGTLIESAIRGILND